MLTGQLGTAPAFGAGIVFGRDLDRLYILTANHVVRRAAVEASNIRVTFKSMPDKSLPAKLLAQADRELDVAVVALEGWAGQGVDGCKLPFDRLGDGGALQRGDTVYAIGNPNGENWRMPSPDRLYNIGAGQLAFQSAFIAGGSSGGALLNSEGRIVGMVRRDEPPSGGAIPMSEALPLVSKWGYPVQLRLAQRDGGTPLHAAATAGDIGRIKAELAAACPDTDVNDRVGRTPLERAVAAGQIEAVRVLIQGGANVKAKSSRDNFTALHEAATRHNQPIAAILLNAGADVNARDSAGGTPLFYVEPAKSDSAEVAQAKTDFVRFLIKAGAEVNVKPRFSRDLPLHQALAAGNREMLAILLAAHADVNLKGWNKLPLDVAVESGDMDNIKLLLQAGADINRSDALQEALHRKNGPLVALLLSSGARVSNVDVDVLQEAIREGWSDVLKILLEAGADVNRQRPSQFVSIDGSGGGSPERRLIDIAIETNHPDMVKLLIAHKANVNVADPERKTPLHLAACKGDSALIKLLVGAGAQVKAQDSHQDTPLHSAIRCENELTARALLQAGAPIDAKNYNGATPLTLAKGTPLESLLRSHSVAPPRPKK
jgi:ankyrin repeat protein